MAMHSDPRQWHPAPGNLASPGEVRPFDWPALAARLAAAGEARMALAHARNFASGGGSFDPDGARALGSFEPRSHDDEALRNYDYPTSPSGVNRVDSGRGKSRSAITGDTAGIDITGDRGLK